MVTVGLHHGVAMDPAKSMFVRVGTTFAILNTCFSYRLLFICFSYVFHISIFLKHSLFNWVKKYYEKLLYMRFCFHTGRPLPSVVGHVRSSWIGCYVWSKTAHPVWKLCNQDTQDNSNPRGNGWFYQICPYLANSSPLNLVWPGSEQPC